MKKVLSLLTLLLAVCSGAWGADATPTYAQPSATLDLQAAGLSTTLSNITWKSRGGNINNAYELTSDYLVLPIHTVGYTTPSWCVKENLNNDKLDQLWSASGPFKAGTNFYTSTENVVVKHTTTRPVAVKVTNCTEAYLYAEKNVILNVYTATDNSSAYNTFTKAGTKTTSSTQVVSVTGLDAAKTYIVEVIGSTASNAKGYAIALKRAALTTAPTITTQPVSATYESGNTPAALTVAATASVGELSYQWYSNTDGDVTGKEEDKIAGATAATLAAANISTASTGITYYYCIVTDGNGSSISNKVSITVVNAYTPVISYASSTNTVTIEYEGSGSVYYTLDNSEPTSSSTAYTAPFVLTNSSTVRAVAINGGNASEIAFVKCKVDHSATAKAILGFGSGAWDGDAKEWVSADGAYKLIPGADSEVQYYTVFGGTDGFKLNHTHGYTLKISDNIKVTSIKFVGISRGDAVNDATIAFDGFTPASGTIEKGSFVKTIEFTPLSEMGYGATIDITTGGNQFGGYFEIYGTEYAPSGTLFEDTTWDFTNWSDATITGVTGDETNWYTNEKSDNSGVSMTGNIGRTIIGSLSNNSLSYNGTKIAETDGLKFYSDAYGLALLFDMKELSGMSPDGGYHSDKYIWLYNTNAKIKIENVTKGSIIEIGLEPHKKNDGRGLSLTNSTQTQGDAKPTAYQVCKWTVNTAGDVTITPTKGLHIYYIKLSKANDAVKITPANEKSTFVTTKALDFSKVSGDLKAYVATAASAGKVTLEEVGAVPAGTPLLLVGTAATEYTVPVATSASAPATNLFAAGDGITTFDGSTYDYILYSDGLFYQIGSGSVAVGKAYLHCDSDPTATGGARGLTLDFGEGETTGIKAIENAKTSNGIYNLNGQRVSQPTRGLYIMNGKKVIIK